VQVSERFGPGKIDRLLLEVDLTRWPARSAGSGKRLLWEQPCGALKHSNRQHLALAANPDFMQRKPGKVEPGPDTASSKTTSLQPKFLVRLSRAFPKPPQSTLLGHSASHSERLFLPPLPTFGPLR
jgi:hypothetical protein